MINFRVLAAGPGGSKWWGRATLVYREEAFAGQGAWRHTLLLVRRALLLPGTVSGIGHIVSRPTYRGIPPPLLAS